MSKATLDDLVNVTTKFEKKVMKDDDDDATSKEADSDDVNLKNLARPNLH